MNVRWARLSQILIVTASALVAACSASSLEAGLPTKPVVEITSPTSSSNVGAGQNVLITFNAADVSGLSQVELVIDGQPVLVEKVDPPVNSYTSSYRWTAPTAGNHVIELRAFNVSNIASDPAQLFILVAGAVADATPTNISILDTPTPTVVSRTPTPWSTPSAAPTATSVPTVISEARVTASIQLNVRRGPSTDFPAIGVLDAGQSATITGRDEFSTWWQIELPLAGGDRGWVAAGPEFSTADNTTGVPVVPAPLRESFVTSTPTSPPPTATPPVLRPTIFSFTADRYTILAGENVILSWDLADAQVALLRYNDLEEGVAAPGSKSLELDETTRFVLVARNEAGDTSAELTITVSDTAVTPVPVLRDGKIRISSGQFIDFDQGLVQDAADSGTDFLWDGQAQQFFSQGGASGTLLDQPYGAIGLVDCQSVSYDAPIADVDGTAQVTGCYLTNEGRYGKFLISDWDFAANLTVEWQTWAIP